MKLLLFSIGLSLLLQTPANEQVASPAEQGESDQEEGGPTPVVIDAPIRLEGPVEIQQQGEAVPVLKQPFVTNWLLVIGAWIAAGLAYRNLKHLTQPRLYVGGLRAVRFGKGLSPVLILKVCNAGQTAALKVPVRIEVYLDGRKTTEYKSGDNPLDVPANGFAEHFIGSQIFLRAEHLDKMRRDGSVLSVKGHVNNEPYCYKYNTIWQDVQELPMFVPCDFDERRNAYLYPKTIKANVTLGSPKVKLTASSETDGEQEVK